ncbi:MAG: flagellar basal body-associated FliL family protein [Sulfitobacter sp.]
MATEEPVPDEDPVNKSKLPLILGLVLALAGGGGGFYATWSGMILGAQTAYAETPEKDEMKDAFSNISFIEVDPLVISVNAQPAQKLLRFRAQLEVPKSHAEDVTKLLPRVVDVLNSYLRALELADLEDQAGLMRLRAQMLRRVQTVTGPERVNDLLIMEFVFT